MTSFPRIIGHRGAAAMAPENTLAAIRAAAAAGATWVEIDVRLAADGLAVIHDEQLDRTTNGTGFVRETPLDTIRELVAGAWFGAAFAGERVPTLDEALLEIQRLGLGVNLELKTDSDEPSALVEAVVRCVEDVWQGDPDAFVFSSFSRPTVWALKEAAPAVPRALIASRVPQDWETVVSELECVSFHPGWRHFTAEQAAAIRAAGYRLAVWTVNDLEIARRLRGWGVDSIITDAPNLMVGLE